MSTFSPRIHLAAALENAARNICAGVAQMEVFAVMGHTNMEQRAFEDIEGAATMVADAVENYKRAIAAGRTELTTAEYRGEKATAEYRGETTDERHVDLDPPPAAETKPEKETASPATETKLPKTEWRSEFAPRAAENEMVLGLRWSDAMADGPTIQTGTAAGD